MAKAKTSGSENTGHDTKWGQGRVDAALAQAYHKDPHHEAFLAELNEALRPHERASYGDHEEHPTIHVVGVPRSGTTLVNQLIASHLGVGAINNLIAAFWAAPCHGIRLSKKLLGPQLCSSMESEYGRTKDIAEPHEFGYFWSELLKYQEMREPDDEDVRRVDWNDVRRVLVNMTHAYGRPIVFKSFMAAWYAEQLQDVLKKSCFVWVRRDPIANASSILRMRRRYGQGEHSWISLKPKEYAWLKHEEPAVQAVGQVVFTEATLDRIFNRIERRNVLEVRYEELCAQPEAFLTRVHDTLKKTGGSIEPPRPCSPFSVRWPESEKDDLERIKTALARFGDEPQAR